MSWYTNEEHKTQHITELSLRVNNAHTNNAHTNGGSSPVSGAGRLMGRTIGGSCMQGIKQVGRAACLCRAPSPAHRPSTPTHCHAIMPTAYRPHCRSSLHFVRLTIIAARKHWVWHVSVGRGCLTHIRCSRRRRERGASGEADNVKSIGEVMATSETVAARRLRVAWPSVLRTDPGVSCLL